MVKKICGKVLSLEMIVKRALLTQRWHAAHHTPTRVIHHANHTDCCWWSTWVVLLTDTPATSQHIAATHTNTHTDRLSLTQSHHYDVDVKPYSLTHSLTHSFIPHRLNSITCDVLLISTNSPNSGAPCTVNRGYLGHFLVYFICTTGMRE